MKFIHTADWQLGKIRDGAPVKEFIDYRFKTCENIRDYANNENVDFTIIAGDIFDHTQTTLMSRISRKVPHLSGEEFLIKSIEILNSFDCKVFILPGNHDFITENCLWNKKIWTDNVNENVIVFSEKETPVYLDDLKTIFYPCPFFENQPNRDLTEWIPFRDEDEEYFRIAIAHGSHTNYGGNEPSPINIDEIVRKDLDYIALGDQHGLKTGKNSTFKDSDPINTESKRIWYPGTPEQCKISEINTGNILEVTLESLTMDPEVKIIPVNNIFWFREEINLDSYIKSNNFNISSNNDLHKDIIAKIQNSDEKELDLKKCILELFIDDFDIPEDINITENQFRKELRLIEDSLSDIFFHATLTGNGSDRAPQILKRYHLEKNSLPSEINEIIKDIDEFELPNNKRTNPIIKFKDHEDFKFEEIKLEIKKLINRAFSEEN